MRTLYFLRRHARLVQRLGFASHRADLPRLRRGPCQISPLLPAQKTQCPRKRIHYFVLYFNLLAVSGCSTVTPKSLQGLDSSQAIIVHLAKKNVHQAQLSAWQKQGSRWHRLLFVSAVIGRNGLAPTGEKKEGDGKTPSGIYSLGPAFGYVPSIDTGLLYRQATDLDFWVDDSQSLQYNQWVSGTPLARSFEKMKRPDNLYQYGIVIGYNMHPVISGAGSAIFIHVWRRYNSPTAGCVALNQRYLRKILRWLDKKDQPVIILE